MMIRILDYALIAVACCSLPASPAWRWCSDIASIEARCARRFTPAGLAFHNGGGFFDIDDAHTYNSVSLHLLYDPLIT
jgi:hypothetical protein